MSYVSEATMLRYTEYIIENISTVFKRTRQNRNLTIAEVGRQTGLSYQTIVRIETNVAKLNQDSLLAIIRWIQRG